MSQTATLVADGLIKRFNNAPLFTATSFELNSGDIVAITGANGSGKSTLLKMLAGVLMPTKGSVVYTVDTKKIAREDYQPFLGYAAPYLELYAELTAVEHLLFVSELKGKSLDTGEAISILTSLGLDPAVAHSDRQVKQYSSGMQQRVKLAMAFALAPRFIFLDEPSSNLDIAGIDRLFHHIKESAADDAIVIIATNDPAETELATRTVALEKYHAPAMQGERVRSGSGN